LETKPELRLFSSEGEQADGQQTGAEHTRFISKYSAQRQNSHHHLPAERGEIVGAYSVVR
jgi:hypothetical protein